VRANLAKDFFKATQETSRSLNQTERKLFEYVVKNMALVKGMKIRELAAECFISTTTIFRFAKKLGFSGYADLINSLLVTAHNEKAKNLPKVSVKGMYSSEYPKNAMEAIRVMSQKQADEVVKLLLDKPDIYILTDDNTHTIGQYCERLFIGLGFHAYFPETAYQKRNLVNRISDKDMLLALSYTGQDEEIIDFISRVFLTKHPYLLSVTRADNNRLENLSDTNFYIFADEIRVVGMDLTSSVAMLMIVELLIYNYIEKSNTEVM
jgi:RpiR family glv operon transcriptional regulator